MKYRVASAVIDVFPEFHERYAEDSRFTLSCIRENLRWRRVYGCSRHVVLPPDIAKLLPKNRLLSEVRYAKIWLYEQLHGHPMCTSFFPAFMSTIAEWSESSVDPDSEMPTVILQVLQLVLRMPSLLLSSWTHYINSRVSLPGIYNRPNGVVSECSSHVGGFTTQFTALSHTLCSSVDPWITVNLSKLPLCSNNPQAWKLNHPINW